MAGVVAADVGEVEDDTDGVEGYPTPEGCAVTEMLCHRTTDQHTDTHTQIPRSEQSGVSRTAGYAVPY